MYSYKNNINQDIYVIKDPASQLSLIVIMVVVGMITLVWILNTLAHLVDLKIGSLIWRFIGVGTLLGIMGLSALRYSAISGGTEIDLINRTMSFPGGGISANDVTNYINLEFLFQLFYRTTIDLDAISEIKRKTEKFTYNGTTWCGYFIEFVGTFGAAHLKFDDEGKRDELFNAIRQTNKMGTPLFNVAGTGNATNTTSSSRGTVFGKSPVTPSAGNKPTSARSFFGKKP